jgi:hypothetical protein
VDACIIEAGLCIKMLTGKALWWEVGCHWQVDSGLDCLKLDCEVGCLSWASMI